MLLKCRLGLPVKPPTRLVLLGTVPLIAIVVIVKGAEVHALMAGPPLDLGMEASSQRVPGVAFILPKVQPIFVL